MNNAYQYYANKNALENSNLEKRNHICVDPTSRERIFDYLLKKNYLSEYSNEESLFEVLYNLGVLQRLSNLKKLIDAKVILNLGLIWDDTPTEGNIDHILSSDTLKQEFLKYYTKTLVDNLIERVWNNLSELIPTVDNTLSNDSENPVLNKIIKLALDTKVSREEIEEILNNLEGLNNLSAAIALETQRALRAEEAISNRVTELETNGTGSDNIRHIILTLGEYDNISTPEQNVLYIIVEDTSSKFGDSFPFTLG